jgi:hypothetical protein
MHRLLVTFVTLLFAGCSEPSLVEELPAQAARSDAVWLCDVDASGPKVRYKAKQALKTSASSIQFTNGQVLPVTGPTIQPGTKFGDEAFIFLSRPASSRPVSADFVMHIYDGVATEGMSRDEVIRTIQEAETK